LIPQARIRLAVFASGEGSNLRNIQQRIEAGTLEHVELALVVSNNSRSGALELARQSGIPWRHLSSRTQLNLGEAMLATLAEFRIDLIVLAGYMKLMPTEVVEKFAGRILNIHPALLPDFGGGDMYGLRVHEAVLASGKWLTGATVHQVTNKYDEGPIVMQLICEVRRDDTPLTLQARVQKVEHNLYPKAIEKVATDLIEQGFTSTNK
jgi:phosphoribosylglycinamide formyltransferase-1